MHTRPAGAYRRASAGFFARAALIENGPVGLVVTESQGPAP